MSILERRVKDCRKTSYFLRYGGNITSQGGEDGILQKIFELILQIESDPPCCVDIGAWDGMHLSNTFNLICNFNWSGLLIEANEDRCRDMSKLYENRSDVNCLNIYVELEGPNSLSAILKLRNVKPDFDFLCIDVDGADYHIWKSTAGSLRPKVVCIEFNPTIANHVVFIQDAKMNIHQGSSLLALTELGIKLGYTLICTTTFNGIFLRNDLVPLLLLQRNTVDIKLVRHESMINYSDYHTKYYEAQNYLNNYQDILNDFYSTTMSTDMFQCYNGEIKICGVKKLIWHKHAMNIDHMQVLKKNMQLYPFAPPQVHVTNKLQVHFSAVMSIIFQVFDHILVFEGLCTSDFMSTSRTRNSNDVEYSAQYLGLVHSIIGIITSSLSTELQHLWVSSSHMLRQAHAEMSLETWYLIMLVLDNLFVPLILHALHIYRGITNDDISQDIVSAKENLLASTFAIFNTYIMHLSELLYEYGDVVSGNKGEEYEKSALDWYFQSIYVLEALLSPKRLDSDTNQTFAFEPLHQQMYLQRDKVIKKIQEYYVNSNMSPCHIYAVPFWEHVGNAIGMVSHGPPISPPLPMHIRKVYKHIDSRILRPKHKDPNVTAGNGNRTFQILGESCAFGGKDLNGYLIKICMNQKSNMGVKTTDTLRDFGFSMKEQSIKGRIYEVEQEREFSNAIEDNNEYDPYIISQTACCNVHLNNIIQRKVLQNAHNELKFYRSVCIVLSAFMIGTIWNTHFKK